MSIGENLLALQILKENYGELAQSLAKCLTKYPSLSFMKIAEHMDVEKKLIAKILSILITNRLVDYELNSRQFVEYKLNLSNILRFIHISK